ncbi:uracil-DNA glycosylase, partial [bacterium]|nr:uracil-DNA glycosylase [bacterium]
ITFPLLKKLSQRGKIVFFLWGNHARALAPELEKENNLILEAAHPSPLSARKFFGCGHFKLANEFLVSIGKSPIVWC